MKREPLLDHMSKTSQQVTPPMTKIRSQKEWKKKGQGVPARKASRSVPSGLANRSVRPKTAGTTPSGTSRARAQKPDKLRLIAEIDFAHFALGALAKKSARELQEEGISPDDLRDASIKLIADIKKRKALLGIASPAADRTLKKLRAIPDVALAARKKKTRKP